MSAQRILAAFATGAVMVTSAWAGASLVPAPVDDAPRAAAAKKKKKRAVTRQRTALKRVAAGGPVDPASLAPGQLLAGAAKISIAPRPDDMRAKGFPDARWETQDCNRLNEKALGQVLADVQSGDHVASTGSPWPENPDCIYMGGFGIGPANPVKTWDTDFGLWVRALALRDREGHDFVLAIVDGEGWFWDYNKKCEDCGIKQITASLAADPDLGVEAKDIVVAATHSHAAPDFIGGWGFVPDWYMRQVTDTIKDAIREAVANQRPAAIEYGERTARQFNSERRETYRSAEEQQLNWFRAYVPGAKKNDPGETIATVGAYAAHPTSKGTNGGEAHPDWPGMFEKRLEQNFGGIGFHFMTGLGNMSGSGLGGQDHAENLGAYALADMIPGLGGGKTVDNPDVKTARTTWVQPATNVPLTALGTPGFFDRQFATGPARISTGEDPRKAQCESASASGVEVPTSVARVGEMAFSASPGEIFSNFSNTMKEKSGGAISFPLGQANDALGYIPQSFEMSPVAQQGLGFTAATGYVFVNYEDSYAIDRCFGDAALETAISQLNALK